MVSVMEVSLWQVQCEMHSLGNFVFLSTHHGMEIPETIKAFNFGAGKIALNLCLSVRFECLASLIHGACQCFFVF